jgi:hypothetical protein
MKDVMRRVLAAGVAAAILAPAGSLTAHHSLAQFDTTTGVTVKGTVIRFERVNPHSFIVIWAETDRGKVRQWALEGPSINQLTRMGVETDAFKAGDVIEACGYVLKDDVRPGDRESVSRRVLVAELLVMPGGRQRVWQDYGHHKCLGPDYEDFHNR